MQICDSLSTERSEMYTLSSLYLLSSNIYPASQETVLPYYSTLTDISANKVDSLIYSRQMQYLSDKVFNKSVSRLQIVGIFTPQQSRQNLHHHICELHINIVPTCLLLASSQLQLTSHCFKSNNYKCRTKTSRTTAMKLANKKWNLITIISTGNASIWWASHEAASVEMLCTIHTY